MALATRIPEGVTSTGVPMVAPQEAIGKAREGDFNRGSYGGPPRGDR